LFSKFFSVCLLEPSFILLIWIISYFWITRVYCTSLQASPVHLATVSCYNVITNVISHCPPCVLFPYFRVISATSEFRIQYSNQILLNTSLLPLFPNFLRFHLLKV
jgi:hypothetical protein